MDNRIGFIGLGIMGHPMASNLLEADFDLTIFNRSVQKTQTLEQKGAKVAKTPKELAENSDVVILMLTGPEAIDSVLENGLLEGLDGSKILINMSTVSPEYTKELDSRVKGAGARFIDAPVSGSKGPAETGSLVILAGGEKGDIGEVREIFDVLGSKTIYCGEIGKGSMMKMAINMLLGVCLEGFSEMITYGEKGGLEFDAMVEVVLSGAMACPMFKGKSQLIKENDFPPQFPLKHISKDFRFIELTAKQIGAQIPVANAASIQYAEAQKRGLGDEDLAAVIKMLR